MTSHKMDRLQLTPQHLHRNDVAFHADTLPHDEHRVNLAALERVQSQLNHMPHVGREPAFPDDAARLLFAPASSA